jgi:hypothetical protein
MGCSDNDKNVIKDLTTHYIPNHLKKYNDMSQKKYLDKFTFVNSQYYRHCYKSHSANRANLRYFYW